VRLRQEAIFINEDKVDNIHAHCEKKINYLTRKSVFFIPIINFNEDLVFASSHFENQNQYSITHL